MGSSGWWSSVLPSVIWTAMIWPWWLMGRWSLKPKHRPIEVVPRWASPWNTLSRLIRAL